MSMIMENIIREVSWSNPNLQDDWLKQRKQEERKQRQAMNRFYRWRANLIDPEEASDYTQAVLECVQRMV